MSVGKSVRLFLADGSPGGLLTAEIMNWTGNVTAAPRSDLATLLKRPEVARTGVYILIGDDPATVTGQVAYIGESDVVGKRLQQHALPAEQNGKDFWSRAVVITSKDMNLTKAHARYLESRFISVAIQAKRVKLTNSTTPPTIALPEADRSDMEYFIEQAKIVLPVLGVNIFRSAATSTSTSASSGPGAGIGATSSGQTPLFELRQKKDGVLARAREVDGEFTVLEGSHARGAWTGVESGYKALRLQLEHDGVIPVAGPTGLRVFSANHVFDSPSAAAAVVLGRSANGRNEWKVAGTGTTYGMWQSSGVEQAAFDLLS